MEKWAIGYLLGHFLSLCSPILLTINELFVFFLSFCFLIAFLFRASNTKLFRASDNSKLRPETSSISAFSSSLKHTYMLVLFGIASGFFVVWFASYSFYQNDFISEPNQEYVLEGKIVSRVIDSEALEDDSEAKTDTESVIDGKLVRPLKRENQTARYPFSSKRKNTKPTRFQLEVVYANETLVKQSTWWLPSKKVALNWYQPNQKLRYGDTIRLVAKLNHSFGFRNEFGFDYRQYAFSKSIYAKGYVKGEVEVVSRTASTKQNTIDDFITVTHGLKSQGALLALILGDRSLLTSSERDLLNHAGVSHLFAISGLHIGVVFLVIKYLLTMLLKRVAHHHKFQLVTLLALVPIWLYVYLLDGIVSAHRAALFVSVWCLSQLVFVNISHFKRLLYIAVLILMFEPFAMLQAAWWLSFFAVFGILIFIEVAGTQNEPSNTVKAPDDSEPKSIASHIAINKIQHYLTHKLTKLKQQGIKLIKFQFFITYWMIPVTIYWFAGFSLSGLLANLIAIPVFCLFVIPYSFVVSLFSLLLVNLVGIELINPDWLRSLYLLPDWVLTSFIAFVKTNEWTHIWMNLPNSVWPLFILFTVCSFILISNTNFPKSFRISLFMAMMLVPLSTVFIHQLNVQTEPEDELTMRVIDVGQGTSVVFNRNNKALVYDLGPVFPSGFSATQSAVEPTLTGIGISGIELLIISHQDSDHRGDITAVQRFLEKDEHSCPKQTLYWQNTKIEPFWPIDSLVKVTDDHHKVKNKRKTKPAQRKISNNDSSCVIKVTDLVTEKSVLLTGDISDKVEKQLVALSIGEKYSRKKLISDKYSGKKLSGIEYSQKIHSDKNSLEKKDSDPQKSLQADILFSAHHGSRFSSSYGFLKAVNPTYLIHTAGLYNRFNFPTKQVQTRARELGIKQFSTSDKGELVLKFSDNDKTLNFETAINKWSPFWKKQNPFSFDLEIR